ncbi:DMT family transporter [Microbaculum marinum]|uniref:DMT family transporter n=1 Tax=Microbaculum marinum TaxID=1764581 RepID=A0AAW9RSJ0_9HYPH
MTNALSPPVAAANGGGSFGRAELALYVATVALWSSGWIGIKLQVGVVPVWQSAFYRFAIATAVMFAWVVLSRRRIAFPWSLHLRFAALGALMFSTNFALFYYAAQFVTSGLLAVVFSLVTVFNPINAALFLRERMSPKALLGALIGITGIAMIYWPEVARPETGAAAVLGLAAAVGGTLTFSLGNIVAFGVHRQGIPVISTNAWGMAYGTVVLGLLVAALGEPLQFEPTAVYAGVLAILGTVSTVLPMATYLTLMRRIGPGRAGYATVMFPIGALAISWLFEGYEWTGIAIAGLALALAGNLFVLGKPRPKEG